MNKRVRLGMLTPSSNTALEPITCAMLAGLPEVSAHFGRFKVTEIALSPQSFRQFDDSEILRAAELLSHAKVDVIAWNGTSASWLGFDRDERLCERITAETGIEAVSTTLAFREMLGTSGAASIGLVTPYTQDVQDRIAATWGGAGLHCGPECHLDIADNFAFGEVTEADIARMIETVIDRGADAVAIVCANMHGARVAAALEQKRGIPIYDSVAVTLWKCLSAASVDPRRVEGWGQLFQR